MVWLCLTKELSLHLTKQHHFKRKYVHAEFKRLASLIFGLRIIQWQHITKKYLVYSVVLGSLERQYNINILGVRICNCKSASKIFAATCILFFGWLIISCAYNGNERCSNKKRVFILMYYLYWTWPYLLLHQDYFIRSVYRWIPLADTTPSGRS